MALIQLIYVSAARKEFDVAELDRILESASRQRRLSPVRIWLLKHGETRPVKIEK